MPHSNTWDDTPLVIGDQAGEGYANINTTHTDVGERMRVEHAWSELEAGATAATDGMHKPGYASVVETLTDAGDLAAAHSTAVNGSVAFAADSEALYVKVGEEQGVGGTWTAVHQDFGDWSSPKTVDQKYTATVAGFVTATLTVTFGTTAQLVGLTDNNDPQPTTIRARTFASYGGAGGDNVQDASICFPVKNGANYKVNLNNIVGSGSTVVIYFIPLT